MIIEQVDRNHIISLWPTIREMLTEANNYSNGEVTEELMLANLLVGAWMLVIIKEEEDIIAACTCDINTFASGKKVLLVGTIGGDKLGDWLPDLHDHLTDIATMLGVSSIYINGRPGWEKVLKEYNFTKIYSTFVRNQ